MDRTIEEMQLDIISWRLEGAERAAEQEFKELCREKPREYGDKPGCKRLNTYKAEFYKSLHKIDSLKMYDRFRQKGWNAELALESKEILLPEIVMMITIGWLSSLPKETES